MAKKNKIQRPEALPRTGRGRKQGNSAFVATENSGTLPRLTRDQLVAVRDFYQSNATQLRQFLTIAREYGCRG